jgi:pyruvate/2-oxoglutarate/acetoin dehydrogenase E1 component
VAAIVAEGALDYLDAPVIRVTGADVPVPAAPVLEDYVLPNEGSIIEAVKRSVGG